MLPFKNIFIPVYTYDHTVMAVERALELYSPEHTVIHLVGSSIRPNYDWNRLWTKLTDTIEFRQNRQLNSSIGSDEMEKLASDIRASHPQTQVITEWITDMAADQYLSQYIRRHNIDLILIVKSKNHYPLPFFATIPVPVLTITPGCLNHPIRSILLPIQSFVPELRIQASLEFAKKFNAQIYLVTILDSNELNTKENVDAFYLTYKLLTEYGHSPHYKILQGKDSISLILRYADQVKADILMVTPEKKRSFFGLLNTQVTDLLHPLSALQVLTLKPRVK